jgi:predicted nucleic acid-binding protein
MAERYLIDTSGAIKYLNGTFPATGLSLIDNIVDIECVLSFVSEIELQVWNPANPADISIYQSFVSNSTIIGIDSEIVKETIRIRKSNKIKLPDALIAATALMNNLTLIADNDKDFKAVHGLKYINPYKLSKKV